AGLELPPTEMPDAVALVVVTLVVEHDVHDRCLVARLRPQRLRTAEQEAAVADDGDHRLIWARKLHAKARRQSPSEHVRPGAEIFLVGAAERHGLFHQAAGIDVTDKAGVLVSRCFELDPDPL